MKIYKAGYTAIFALFFLALQAGCSGNLSAPGTISKTSAFPKVLKRAEADKRYLVMYSGVDTYHVKSVQVEKTRQQFTVYLTKVDSLHTASLRSGATGTEKLLQMYMRDSTSYTLDEPHTIPMNKVARMEL